MKRILLPLVLALAVPAVASAQPEPPKPRKASADTAHAGRPAGDSIVFAGEGAEKDDDAEDRPAAQDEGLRPFAVESSGSVAARPRRGEVVWVDAPPPARVAVARDTATAERPARDTAATPGTRRRTASRDTAATTRPPRTASRDTTAGAGTGRRASRDSATATRRPASRDTAASRPGRTPPRDTVTIRTANRDTVRIRTPQGGRTGTPATTSTRARTHRVGPGETWYGIARRYGVTSAQLRAVNPDVEWQSIRTGQVLNLPAAARDSRAPATPTTPARTGQQGTGSRTSTGSRTTRTHTVAAGETLFGIARRYGVTVAALREANDLETDRLRTGQRLVIPPAS